MALKGHRHIVVDDVTYRLDSAAEMGVGLCYSVAGSGSAMDDGAEVQLAADPSGLIFKGILINDVVDIDLSRYKLNEHKEEVIKGSKVTIMTQGWVVTNKVTSTPTAGDVAYLTANGVFTDTVSATGGTAATPVAGRFESSLDENGFAKVSINVP